MKRHGLGVILCTAALAWLPGCRHGGPAQKPRAQARMQGTSQPATQPAEQKDVAAWGRTVKGLQARLSAAKRKYKLGQDVVLTLTIRNVSPKPITLPAGQLHDALGVREVTYTKGQQALALKDQKLQ